MCQVSCLSKKNVAVFIHRTKYHYVSRDTDLKAESKTPSTDENVYN